MFKKVMRISHNALGEEKSATTIINTDTITSVKEVIVGPTTEPLYDSEGEFVENKITEEEKVEYHVYQTSGPRIKLTKESYEELVKALVK